jgi:hypothetical protein
MNCPNCGAPEKILVKYCQSCGTAFASQDLLEFYQLEFLLKETSAWGVREALRQPYLNRFKALRFRLQRFGTLGKELTAGTVPAQIPEPASVRAEPLAPVAASKPSPTREPVPFDQWLLSERNIKIALYTGGLLLLLAGVIFIGVNWARLPGLAKFSVTLTVTGLSYLGGSLLHRRPMLRLGGVALLAVASGFLALNFAVLQIYVLEPRGMRDDVMWLIASSLCLLLYLLTTYWTHSSLFTYISLIALGNILTATLVVVNAPWLTYVLAAGLLALMLLYLARVTQKSNLADFACLPLTITSQCLMPLAFATAFIVLFARSTLETDSLGSSWLALLSLLVGILFYDACAYWRRSKLFTYLGLASTACTLAGFLWLINAPGLVYILAGGLFALGLLGLARVVWHTDLAVFAKEPLLVAAHAAMPVALLSAITTWTRYTGCETCGEGSPWLSLLTLGLGVMFYALNDALFKRLEARWAGTILLPVSLACTLIELNFSDIALAIGLMLLALVFLGSGYLLERRERKRSSGWPLYAVAYAVAIFVTVLAVGSSWDLVKILVGDVILLTFSAAIHRDYRWLYGAIWLLMLPVYLAIDLLGLAPINQGLLMGLLGLIYTAAGCGLGKRQLWLGGPFLTAAAFIGPVSVALTWESPIIATLVLLSIAGLYLFVALWTRWEWLLLPALLAVELAVYTLNCVFFISSAALERPLVLSFFTLGGALALIGAVLRGHARGRWFWPLYLASVLNLAAAYVYGLINGGWMAIVFSLVLASILLAFAWLERAWFAKLKLPPALTYLGIAVLYTGHFYAIEMAVPLAKEVWPAYAAGLCALFVVIAWALRSSPMETVYGTPVRLSGLWMMVISLAASLFLFEPILGVITYTTAGLVYVLDAWLRRILKLAYLGIGALVVATWAMLYQFDVVETQAYAIPLALVLLGIGWNERLRGARLWYRIPTLLGLLVLIGSAFIQSLPRGAYIYALLLLVESLIMVGWGARTRSKSYVQVGALALIANAVVQLGPAFVEMERWIQLGVTGTILLGGGIAALFKREEILVARQRLTEEWGRWQV